MANRRKFIAGLGALATGSAAAVGTGAFSTVWADRSVSVSTTGDANAYLGFEKKSSEVSYNGNQMEIDVQSLNADANTRFYNSFWIRNNGTNDVSITAYTLDSSGNLGGWDTSDFALYWSTDEIDEDTGNFTYQAMHNVRSVDAPTSSINKSIPRLAPGEAIAVHPQFFLRTDSGTGDIPSEISFYASRTNTSE